MGYSSSDSDVNSIDTPPHYFKPKWKALIIQTVPREVSKPKEPPVDYLVSLQEPPLPRLPGWRGACQSPGGW
jgi:hypothetical protein